MPFISSIRGTLGSIGRRRSAVTNALGSFDNPAVSAVALVNAGNTTDGKYWIQPTGETKFLAYCILSKFGGGWIKFAQYYNNTDLSTTAAVNPEGAWCDNEVGLAAGKLTHAQIHAIQAQGTNTAFLFRVTGGSDNLLNNGSGTGKMECQTGTLPNFGTDEDPTRNWDYELDMTSDGSFEYVARYGTDPQGRCGHPPAGTKIWMSDHNYAGSWIVGTAPYNSLPICHSIGTNGFVTNLHWMSGLPSQSSGDAAWGTNSSTAASFFIK